MWIAKKPFKNYQKGDEVKKEDAMHYGSLYCAQSGDAAKQVAVDNDIQTKSDTPADDITPADTNETPEAETAGNIVTDAENQSEAESTAEEPNLEAMSYQDLKSLAVSKGLEFPQNISTVKLIALIKG